MSAFLRELDNTSLCRPLLTALTRRDSCVRGSKATEARVSRVRHHPWRCYHHSMSLCGAATQAGNKKGTRSLPPGWQPNRVSKILPAPPSTWAARAGTWCSLEARTAYGFLGTPNISPSPSHQVLSSSWRLWFIFVKSGEHMCTQKAKRSVCTGFFETLKESMNTKRFVMTKHWFRYVFSDCEGKNI